MRAPKYCSQTDCMELVPGGTRNCSAHTSRWDTTPREKRKRDASWFRLRASVLKRDNHTCVYCRAPATVVDHVVALAHGGTDTASNLVAACRKCNDDKAKHEALESRLSR